MLSHFCLNQKNKYRIFLITLYKCKIFIFIIIAINVQFMHYICTKGTQYFSKWFGEPCFYIKNRVISNFRLSIVQVISNSWIIILQFLAVIALKLNYIGTGNVNKCHLICEILIYAMMSTFIHFSIMTYDIFTCYGWTLAIYSQYTKLFIDTKFKIVLLIHKTLII